MEPIPDARVVYLAALHDLGKADAMLQNKDAALAATLRAGGLDLPEKATRFQHEARSADWLTPQGTKESHTRVPNRSLACHV